jgi:hypothetical protein
MSKPLTLEVMKEQVPKNYKNSITQEVVDEINKLVEDPDYGEEFRDAYLTHTNILSGKENFSLKTYANAIKFYSLTAAGLPAVRAYVKVFPERLQARIDRGQTINDMPGEASRFNSSDAVNKIRAQALIPIHLVNQGTVQKAINSLTTIMLNGKSEVARVSAATALLKELRPPETQQVELQLGMSDAALEAQAKQNEQLASIAENQRKLLMAGANINDIQQIHVTTVEVCEEDE